MSLINRRALTGALVGSAALSIFVPTIVDAEGESTHIVEITGFEFVPSVLEVRTGDKIKWINRDIAPHTATAVDETWDTGDLGNDDSIITVVDASMSGKYFCRFHPHMKAELKLVTD